MKEYEWCNFEWNKEMFPDPKAMLKRLHEKGLEVCVWINPYVAQRSRLFQEGKGSLRCLASLCGIKGKIDAVFVESGS